MYFNASLNGNNFLLVFPIYLCYCYTNNTLQINIILLFSNPLASIRERDTAVYFWSNFTDSCEITSSFLKGMEIFETSSRIISNLNLIFAIEVFFIRNIPYIIIEGYILLLNRGVRVDKTYTAVVIVDSRRWINRERNTSYISCYNKGRYVSLQTFCQE